MSKDAKNIVRGSENFKCNNIMCGKCLGHAYIIAAYVGGQNIKDMAMVLTLETFGMNVSPSGSCPG